MIIDDLAAVIRERRSADPSDSYTARLLADPVLVQRKIMEEAFEVCLELGTAEHHPDRIAEEAADLLYHLLVGLEGAGVEPSAVWSVLEGRAR